MRVNFGFQKKYEDLFTKKLSEYHGSGRADSVSLGTAAVNLALKTLDLETGCDVIIPSVTNPMTVQDVKLVISNLAPNV